MLPTYDREFRAGRLNMRPTFRTVREGPAFALIDADASLGHPVSVHGDEPRRRQMPGERRGGGVGVQLAPLRGGGLLSRIAADRGVIGMVTASTRGVTLVPTSPPSRCWDQPAGLRGAGRRNAPFQLDMATTTVAAGKVKIYRLNHRALPAGWVVDDEGRTVTDAEEAFGYVFSRPEGGITPLGGRGRVAATRATGWR